MGFPPTVASERVVMAKPGKNGGFAGQNWMIPIVIGR